jgi:hypothetical protein
VVRHRRYEAITALPHRLDESGLFRIVAERRPDGENVTFQNLGLHMEVRPEALQEIVMAHQLSRSAYQEAQNVERLGRQFDAFVCTLPPGSEEQLVLFIEPKWWKFLHGNLQRGPSNGSGAIPDQT